MGEPVVDGILAGLRVVEIGRRIAAPLTGMLLAEQGAEVLRVVDTSRPAADPVLDALLARGKVEAALDLSTAAGRDTLRRLAAGADVVLENLGPGETECLGLRFDELRAANPGLVSCSIPAFPAGHPEAGAPDHEAVPGAAGCLYDGMIGAPRYHTFPVASVMAGLFAANGVVAALVARLRLGRGQHVDATLLYGALFAQVLQVLIKTGVPRGFLGLKMVASPAMGAWRCQDGRYVYLHITLPAHTARLLTLLAETGHAEHARALEAVLSPETRRDPSQVKSIAEAKAIRAVLQRIFLERPAAEWERVLGRELCCIVVRTVEEWLGEAAANGMPDAAELIDPVLGPLTGPGPGVTLSGRPAVLRPRVVGDEAWRAALGRWEAAPRPGPDQVPPLPADPGAPLAGLRVVDLSRVIAGPCAARLLAELGADVLSIQSRSELDWALSFHLIFNAGKRSVTLDFTTDEGKRRLQAIVADHQPHAFLQNYRNLDVARAAGVGPESMRERFPELVYTHLNAYGNEGAWRERPGFEQVVQAVSGIQMTYGRTVYGDHGRPRLLPTPVIDIGSGLLGAFATVLGLYQQQRTGAGVFGATHLTRVSVLLQLPAVAEFQRDRCLRAAAAAQDAAPAWEPARAPVAGILRALDGWLCVAGPRDEVRRRLARVGLVPADGSSPGADPFAAVGRRSWLRTAGAWQAALAAARTDGGAAARPGGDRDEVAVVPLPGTKRFVRDAIRRHPGRLAPVAKRAYPGTPMPLTFVRSPLVFSLTPLVDVPPPAVRGADTRAALARIGETVPEGSGVVPYPADRPFVLWAVDLVRWGFYAWRSGSI